MYTPKGELNDALLELMKDPEKIKELEGLKSPEEGLEVVKKYIPDMTLEEFQKSMQIMRAYLEESQEGLLSEEDLDSVAGGKGNPTKTIVGTLGAVGAVGGAVGAVVSTLAFTA